MVEKNKALRNIDKPFYGYWQALYHSFFNNKLYVDVGKRWRGLGLRYLLLLMFIVTIPFSWRAAGDMNRFFMNDLIQPLQQLPKLYIQNGILSTDAPMPYFVRNDKNQIAAIVDTTGKITTIDQNYPDLKILFTADRLFLRFFSPQFFFSSPETQAPPGPIYVYPFTKTSNSVFYGKEWIQTSGILHLKMFFAFLIYPTLALLFFAFFTVFFLAFALMGQLIAKIMKFSISYKQSCASNCEYYAFYDRAVDILTSGMFSARYSFFMPLIFIAYFCYAVLSLKKESQKLVMS